MKKIIVTPEKKARWEALEEGTFVSAGVVTIHEVAYAARQKEASVPARRGASSSLHSSAVVCKSK
jgi:hypothetical protein